MKKSRLHPSDLRADGRGREQRVTIPASAPGIQQPVGEYDVAPEFLQHSDDILQDASDESKSLKGEPTPTGRTRRRNQV